MKLNSATCYDLIRSESSFLLGGKQNTFTPQALVNEIITYIPRKQFNGKTLVYFNNEIVATLKYDLNVDMSNVYFFTDCPNKAKLATRLGATIFNSWSSGMKFDVIIGNPPYQDTDVNGDRKSLSTNLWSQFIDIGFNGTTPKGYIAMITPAAWAAPTKNLSGNRKILKDLFAKNNPIVLNISNQVKKHFSGVGSSFSYFVVQKASNAGKTKIVIGEGETFETDITPYESLPRSDSKLAFSINAKYFKRVVGEVIQGQLQAGDYSYSPTQDKDHPHAVYHTPAKGGTRWFMNINHPNEKKHKVIISLSGTYTPYMDSGKIGYSDMCLAYIVKSGETVDSAFSVINSKLFHFIMNSNKWSGFNNKQIIRTFALPTLNRVYSDQDIYNHFGLTQEEIDYVEANA